MEKLDLDKEPRHRNVRILDITGEQVPTLIRLGYASTKLSPPPVYRSSNFMDKQTKHQKKFDRKNEMIWQRWRDKIPYEDEVRKRLPGYVEAWKIPVTEQEARNRQIKLSPSSVNVGDYTGMYNGMYNGFVGTQQMALHNDPFEKKLYEKMSTCQKITSNCLSTFKEYCYHCTLHGLKYIGDISSNYFQKAFWVLSFIFALMGVAYFIWHLYEKYSTTPIIISRSSETVSIDQFPFPAVTVCNMNNAKKSVAKEIVKGNDTLQKFYLDDICEFRNETTAFLKYDERTKDAGAWENIYQFLLNVSQSCSQMIYYCRWRGNVTNCTDAFNPVLTDEGLCCRFNSVPNILYESRVWENLDISYSSNHISWNPEYKFTKEDSPNVLPWRAFGSGSYYGLTLALDVAADEYFCSSTSSVGFKMLLHSPVEMPQIAEFAFTLSPGKETRVIITPHITESDISIIKIPVKIRRCYFLNEKKLRYYRIYTQSNCVLECEANFTLNYCQCMEYYMPVTNNTRICGKNDDDCTDVAKRIMENKLYEDDDSRAVYNITETPSCKCYPGCNEINYSTEISQSILVTTFWIPEEIYKHPDDYFEKNVAIVHIFFIDTSYMKYTKNIIYGFAELLSNTGGLLGLFLGFSLLSVVEIFYFTTRLMWRITYIIINKKNQNKVNSQELPTKHGTIYPFAQ